MLKANSKRNCQIDKVVISANQELFLKFINISFLLIICISITLIFCKHSEQLEWFIYIIGSLSILLVSFIANYFINKISKNSYKLILLFDIFFLLFLIPQLYVQKFIRFNHLILILLALLLFLENHYSKDINDYKIKVERKWTYSKVDIQENRYFTEILLINILSIIVVLSYFTINFLNIEIFPISKIFEILAIIIIVNFIFLYKIKYINKINKINSAIFLLFLLLIIFVIIQKPIDYHTYTYYVGPILDVIKGKSILIDTPSQYGYLSIHFLALILGKIGLTFDSFHLINTLLFCLFFLLASYIFLKLIRNRCLAVICAIIFITLQTLFTYTTDILYPPGGPLRFGFGLLIIWLLTYKPNKLNFAIGTILASVSLFWAVETAIYIIPAWIAACLTYSYISTDTAKKFWKSSILKIFLFLFTSTLIFFLIILKEYSAKHTFPNIQNYFDYALAYKNGFLALPIPLWGNYYLVVIVMILGLVIVTHLVAKKIKTDLLPLLVFISIHNIAIFSYFVSRSHELNILNITGFTIIEMVVIVIIMIDVLKIDIILLKKMTTIPVILFLVLFAFELSDQIAKQPGLIQNSIEKNMQSWLNPKTSEPILLNMLAEYSLSHSPIVILADNKDTLLLVDSNLKNELPLNPANMTNIPPNWQNKYIEPAVNKLQSNTVIIVDENIENSWLNSVWIKITDRYILKKIGEIKEEKLDVYQIVSTENLIKFYGTGKYGFITMLYSNILNRAPDEVGLNGWVEALNNKKITADKLIENFIFSDEFKIKFNLNDKEYIYFLFKALLYRIPDDTTLSNYLNELNTGKTKKDILDEVLNLKEWKEICILFNVN